MKKVAIYCRLSSEDRNKIDPDEDSRSIQTQKTMLIDEAIKRGWDIYNIYSDDDFSGTDSNRPEYKKLLQDAEERKFDVVLCKSQSRFTRDMEHVEKYINGKFREWNIRFVSILDNTDTNIKGNKKARQIHGLVNQWYIEDLSENIQQAFITRKKQGLYIGSFACYGYLKDPSNCNHLVIDPNASQIVKRIFFLFLNGHGCDSIAKKLSNEGVLPPAEYKNKFIKEGYVNSLRRKHLQPEWNSSSVYMILTNETYIGNLAQNKSRTVDFKSHKRIKISKEDWIRSENTHEPIISKEDFLKVQQLLKKRTRPKQGGGNHLFSGKLVCGECGHSMFMNSSRGEHRYYRCMRNKESCKGICVSEKYLISHVLDELKQYVTNYMSPEYLAEKIQLKESLYKDVECIREQVKKNEKKLKEYTDITKTLYSDRVNGIISIEDFKQLQELYMAEKEQLILQNDQLKEQLSKTEKRLAYERENEKTEILEHAKEILTLDTFTRNMAEELIEKIKVWDAPGWGNKYLEIYWNF